MTISAFAMAILFFVVVFSQFGGRIRATNAISWWLIALFLLIGAGAPSCYLPLINLLGIRLVSNFVMAVVMLFLMYQVLEINSIHTFDRRRFRAAFSRLAAQRLVDLRSAQPASAKAPLRVLVVLPCYNEQAAIPGQVEKLEALRQSAPFVLDYCFVDDASSDDSAELLERLAPLNHARHTANLGVSGGLLTGFMVAKATGADYVVQCDGDGQHPVREIPRLVAAAQGGADLVVGSRFCRSDERQVTIASTTALRRAGSILIIWTLRILWPGSQASDPTSGFRVYSRRAVKFLSRAMPDEYPEPETIALAHSAGLKTVEVAVQMEARATGESSISGLKSALFMAKVMTALLGLRLRSLVRRQTAAPAS